MVIKAVVIGRYVYMLVEGVGWTPALGIDIAGKETTWGSWAVGIIFLAVFFVGLLTFGFNALGLGGKGRLEAAKGMGWGGVQMIIGALAVAGDGLITFITAGPSPTHTYTPGAQPTP